MSNVSGRLRWLSAFVMLVVAAMPASADARVCARSAVPGAEATIEPARGIDQKLFSRAVLAEVNYHRCRAGRGALAAADELLGIAEVHARWMARARKMTHFSSVPGQRSPAERLRRSGLLRRAGSENIAMVKRMALGTQTFMVRDASSCHFTIGGARVPAHSYASLARYVMDLWMASPDHRRDILQPQVRATASAVALDERGDFCGDFYIAQEFAG